MFCEGLSHFQFTIEQHHEHISQIITLVDPFQNGPRTSEVSSRKFQDMLIAPYRLKLRGSPHFVAKGAISDDLAVAAMAQITWPRMGDYEIVLSELEELKAKGNESFRMGDLPLASENWSRALINMRQLMQGPPGAKLEGQTLSIE